MILICTLLFAIAAQDFKERAVVSILFPVLFFLIGIYVVLKNGLQITLLQTVLNLVLILFFSVSLFLIYGIREKSFKRIINKKLGMGDLVFWASVTPLFSVLNFVLWFISSLVFTLIAYLCFTLIYKQKKDEFKIPLAGFQALFLAAMLIINERFFHWNFSVDIVSLIST